MTENEIDPAAHGAVSYAIGWAFDGGDMAATPGDAQPLEGLTVASYQEMAFELAAERLSAYVRYFDAEGNEVEL
ncbi:MAG TPA: hypothetical protein VF228_17365 [Iamia sp.]